MPKRKRRDFATDDVPIASEHKPKVTRHHLAQEIAEARMPDMKVLYQVTRNLRPGIASRLVGYTPTYSFEKGRH